MTAGFARAARAGEKMWCAIALYQAYPEQSYHCFADGPQTGSPAVGCL